MRTVGTIVRYEWRLMLRDRLIVPLLVILTICSFWAAHAGRRSISHQRESLTRLAMAERNRMLREQAACVRLWNGGGPFDKVPAYGPLDPQYVRNFAGFSAAISSAPLSALGQGADEMEVAAYTVVPSGSLHISGATRTTLSPLHLLIGSFDLELVVIAIYSLSVLGVTYSMLSADRESGVESLWQSIPISPSVVTFARLLSRVAVIALFCLLIGASGLWAVSDSAWIEDGSGRLMLWTAATFLYGLVWLAASWFAGGIARSSSRSALLLGGLWLLSTVVVPSALRFAAALSYPVEPRTGFFDAIRRGPDEFSAKDDTLRDAFLRRHPEYAGVAFGPSGNAQLTSAARSEELARGLDRLADRYDGQQRRQREFVARWSWLSPALLMQHTLRDAAGIEGRAARFRDQARTYQEKLEAFYWPLLFGERVFAPDLYSRIPRFSYQETPLREVLPGALFLLLESAAWAFGLGLAAFFIGQRH